MFLFLSRPYFGFSICIVGTQQSWALVHMRTSKIKFLGMQAAAFFNDFGCARRHFLSARPSKCLTLTPAGCWVPEAVFRAGDAASFPFWGKFFQTWVISQQSFKFVYIAKCYFRQIPINWIWCRGGNFLGLTYRHRIFYKRRLASKQLFELHYRTANPKCSDHLLKVGINGNLNKLNY